MEIRELVLEKRRARRKWQQSRFLGDKVLVNRLSKQLKKLLRRLKMKYCVGFSITYLLMSTEYSLWKAAKNNRPKIQDPPLKMGKVIMGLKH